MANTYSQVNTHTVFMVKGRENVLNEELRERLFEFVQLYILQSISSL